MLKFWYDFQVSIYLSFINISKYHSINFCICYPINIFEMADSQLHAVIEI